MKITIIRKTGVGIGFGSILSTPIFTLSLLSPGERSIAV